MASIRQTDTLHNKRFSKGRPAKVDRERHRKRQETYRWRDARRIYLANSFDRWRKLRSSLGLKDSVLAWHLMEAHEKDPCGICRRDKNEDLEESPDGHVFFPQLVKAVRKACLSQLQFEKCIRVVGYLCLEFDNSRKENFSIDETISSPMNHSNEDVCISPPPPPHPHASSSTSTDGSDTPGDSSSLHKSKSNEAVEFETCSVAGIKQESEFLNVSQMQDLTNINTEQNEVCIKNELDPDCQQPFVGQHVEYKHDRFEEPPAPVSEINKSYSGDTLTNFNSSSYMESETEVSLEIDVEKIDTSQEPEELSPVRGVAEASCDDRHGAAIRSMSYPSSVDTVSPNGMPSHKPSMPPSVCAEGGSGQPSPFGSELPLDMSVDKADGHQKEDRIQHSAMSVPSPSHRLDLCQELSVDTSYSDHKAQDLELPVPKESSLGSLPSPHCGRIKEEAYPSIPWQRRDMSRKEEYEFLELNPFCDLSEFSHRYPHVHQRTYYRWKRRIKEEYIILEQCPSMTFDEFSSVVLQAKLSVFNLWKALIAQGKGFFAPSDASKRLEAKCPLSKSVNTLGEQYVFLQKNLSCTQEQFCQKFLETSPEIFFTLKKKVMQEFWVFYHNSHLDWRDLSKLVDVSEDVYNCWRDNITRDIKSVMGGLTPNAHMMPSHHPHHPTFQHAPHLQANITPVESSTPEESRNLSASYLNSMQNMMFPWSSYYAVHSPINQQLLPMVMWPRMMNLNGGKPPALNLPMASPSSCGSQSESPHQEMSAINQPHQPPHANLDVNNLMEGKPRVFSPHRESESCDFLPVKVKRGSSHVPNDNELYDYGHVKKQKVSEELDSLNSQSPVNKSRKQNKQEYVYYLKNPSLSFKDLETLFPSISLRTFYRWRKEMNAALLYMRENKDPNYHQFQLVFPDIPEDVFTVWRTKSGKENFAERILFTQNVQTQEVNDDVSKTFENTTEPVYSDQNGLPGHYHADRNKDYSILGEASPSKKQFKTGHLFIHKNPNIDFTAFSKLFPHISARSFYRWKKEWKDAIDLLQANPDLDYDRYKSIDSSVSEEIFEAWKQFSLAVKPLQKEGSNSGHSPLSGSNNNIEYADVNHYSSRKHNCHEFSYLQLHSQIDFDDFNKMYPHISRDTFDQWQKDIHQIINYIHTQPSVSFDEISAVLSGVTEEAFLKWKEQASVANSERKKISTDESGSEMRKNDFTHNSISNNDEAKMQITNALLHLMHRPNIKYQDFSQVFPIISSETFDVWLRRIKYFIQQISSNPSLEFEEFRSVCNEIEEDVFRKWKSLTPEEICAIGKQTVESLPSSDLSLNHVDRDRAFYYCQQNPHISYAHLSEQYCNISETDFKCWILKISNQMSFIRDNPSMSFKDFSGIYPEVEKAIFDLWRNLSTNANTLPHSFKSDRSTNSAESRIEGKDTLNSIRNSESDHNMLSSNVLSPGDDTPGSPLYVHDNDREDQESSLKKLAKLADRNAPYSCGLNSRMASDTAPSKDDAYPNHVPTSQAPSLSRENGGNSHRHNFTSDKHGFVNDYEQHYHYVKSSADQNLLRPDILSSPRTSEPLYEDSININTVDNCVENQAIVAPITIKQENQSLSNLMVVSADHHKFSSVTSTSKMEKSVERVSQPLTPSDKWNYAHMPAASVKDDEEMFSSQRQKKMSRAEYLFVKDNPDVDSQEFARIFPGVSARTFYRWKKEIKAQMQVA